MGFLSDLFGGGAEADAANKNRTAYNQYGTDSQNYLSQGYTTAQGNLNNALGAYNPLSTLASKYGQGTDMYLNALGLNGASGTAAAQGAFTTSPGYSAGIDAGLDAINRRRAAGRMLNSGNADQDAQTFGQNAQNQQYNTWLGNLSGLNQNNLAATGTVAAGQAGAFGSLADLATNNAQNQVGVAGNMTSGVASANNLEAQGRAAGAKNLLGAGLSLASLGTQAFGGGSAFGNSGSGVLLGGANGPAQFSSGQQRSSGWLGSLFN